MQINLQHIRPSYFTEAQASNSEIWNKELVFQLGEQVQIVAPSGSGKTSLMHFLYGVRNDYNGNILYDKSDIKSFDAEKFAKWRQQHISIVFQDLRLFPMHTAWQNIEVKRMLQPYHDASRIIEMAAKLGIENKMNSLCQTCSYGEQQRIAIIRALQQPFDFLLLDEPLSHLDEANREKAMELILEEAGKRKAAVILADLKAIEYFPAQKTIVL